MAELHRSLERALSILEIVAGEEKGSTLTEICMSLELPKSSAFPLIHTLANRDYLRFDQNSGRYNIGLKAFETGSSFINNRGVSGEIVAILEELMSRTQETVHLAVIDKTEVVYLYKCEGQQQIRMASHIGKRLPAHGTAIGKALLSGYPDSEINEMYKEIKLFQLTQNTITDIKVLVGQMEAIRHSGIAHEIEESSSDITCIATPVKNRRNMVVAAISIAIPVFRADEARLKEFEGIILECSKKISKLIGNSTFFSL